MKHRLLTITAFALAMCAGLSTALAADHRPACASDRSTCILEAIAQLDPGASVHWTKTGKPKVSAIEAIAGLDISGAERDAAWAAYAEWEARRGELRQLRSALASVTAERDRRRTDASALRAERDQARADARAGARAAAQARNEAADAQAVAGVAQAQLRALAAGEPVCTRERTHVAADDSLFAGRLRVKTLALLRCLDIAGR